MKLFRWRRQHDEELDAEIRSHLDQAIRDRMERGETPDEARANALREFGNVGLVKEVTREMWGWATLERLGQDVRFGLRMLRKNPGFSLVAILTLALGISANTLIFSVVNALLLRPLPYRNAERIVAVSELVNDGSLTPVSPANWQDLRAQQTVFESIAAVEFDAFNLAGAQQPEHVSGAWASAELFRVLQVEATLGRTLLPEDERPESARTVLLSHGLWQRRFGGEANLIGKQVNLYGIDNPQEGGSYTVVGVPPQNFWFASQQFDV
ncbi:MAG: ABC transporter permease [Blastocatellia bacterium]